jgi:predicted HAD superfamily Cof-like phosphohydrolase
MSSDWSRDVTKLHMKMGHVDAFKNLDKKMLKKLLNFRVSMLDEEMSELIVAIEDKDSEGVVDALIDLCVFAIGTLDMLEVDANRAWNSVFNANLEKTPGVKEGRPNPFGLPDMIKPEGWQDPSHNGNHGRLEEFL